MAFIYNATPPSKADLTPTVQSKATLTKSFLINIAAGSPFITATEYTLGYLPKGAQLVGTPRIDVATAVSGGTVSAATLVCRHNNVIWTNGTNVFASGGNAANGMSVYYASLSTAISGTDGAITYTPTLTGSGATAGIIYITVSYVI